MRRFASLRRSGDFARVRARGRRIVTTNLTIVHSHAAPGDTSALVGISVSKAVGGAVTRNRVKRRLLAALQETMPEGARLRLVISARANAAAAAYSDLRDEVAKVFA